MNKPNENNQGYKHTSIRNVPATWKWYELGELLDLKNGVNSDKESYGEGHKFINVLDVLNNTFITASKIIGSVTLDETEVEANLVLRGDVLFNRTSETPDEIGMTSVYLDDDPVVFGGFVIRGRPQRNILLDDFKKYCFSSSYFRKQVVASGQGAIRSNIGQSDLEKVWLLVPSEDEQEQIAKILSTWDNGIETTQQLIAQKELHKKALMQHLLTGKKRLEGFGEKAEYHVLSHYVTEVSERNSDNKITRVLSVTNSRGFIVQAEQFDRVVASDDSTNYKIVRKDQFAYNPSRVNVGSLDLLKTFDEGILSPMYVVFETDHEKMLPDFLYYLLKSYWFTGHIPMFVQGSVRDSLSFDGLSGMKFFIPSIEEQTAIASVLRTADRELDLLRQKLDSLKEQKKGLMQKLLTGEIRVKVKNG